jgi:hypothetical protein
MIHTPAAVPRGVAPAEEISVTGYLSAYPPNYKVRDMLTYFVGRLDYTDTFGVAHWLTFCQFVVDDGGIRYCEQGNDRDPDPAPGSG